MRGAEESGFKLGGGYVNSPCKRPMEVSRKGGGIALFRIRKVTDGALAKVEAEHGSDPLEGEGLPLGGRADAILHQGSAFLKKTNSANGSSSRLSFESTKNCYATLRAPLAENTSTPRTPPVWPKYTPKSTDSKNPNSMKQSIPSTQSYSPGSLAQASRWPWQSVF